MPRPCPHKRKPRSAARASGDAVGEKKPTVGSAMCKVAQPTWSTIGALKTACRVVGHLSRKGTLDRESSERVTADEVEAILAALTLRAGNPLRSDAVREATKVSEVGRSSGTVDGTNTPTQTPLRLAEAIRAS